MVGYFNVIKGFITFLNAKINLIKILRFLGIPQNIEQDFLMNQDHFTTKIK